MKMTLLISIFSIFFLTLSAPPITEAVIVQGEGFNPYLPALNAIYAIESSSGVNLLNKTEGAVGPFGIRVIRLKDYNQKNGTHITIKQCYDYQIAKSICLYYITQVHYRDIKGIAHSWNGYSTTNKYYDKLKKLI